MLTGRRCGSTRRDIRRRRERDAPASGVSNPASIRSSVVLPQPIGPSSAKNSPALISSDRRSTAVNPPKRFDRIDPQQRQVRRIGGMSCLASHSIPSRFAMKAIAFSSEVDTGSREENASKHKDKAPLLSDPIPVITSVSASLLANVEIKRPPVIHGVGRVWMRHSGSEIALAVTMPLDATKDRNNGRCRFAGTNPVSSRLIEIGWQMCPGLPQSISHD